MNEVIGSRVGLLRFHKFHFRFDSVRFFNKNRGFGSVFSYLLAILAESEDMRLGDPGRAPTGHSPNYHHV